MRLAPLLLAAPLLVACGGGSASAPAARAPGPSRAEASGSAESPERAEPERSESETPQPFEPDLAARTLESPPFDYYVAPGTRSFMWADLERVRLAASDEIVGAVTESLRGLHPDLPQLWEQPATDPARIERFAITSMGARNRWVATLVYREPITEAMEALFGPRDNRNVGGPPRPSPIGSELLAAQVAPNVLVLGTVRDVRGALPGPPQPTGDVAAEGHLFVWTMTDARRWLTPRPRSANPNDLRLVLRLDTDRRFTIDARGGFEDAPAAAAAQTVWRDRLVDLGDNSFVRALGVAAVLARGTVSRPEPATLSIELRATPAEVTQLARLFAMTTVL